MQGKDSVVTHEILLDEAKRAIDRMVSDTSVPRETTLEDLAELRDDLDIRTPDSGPGAATESHVWH